jgi:hypothetical protein
VKITGAEGVGLLWSVLAILMLPLALWSLLTGDWIGVAIKGTVAAAAAFIARRAFIEADRAQRGNGASMKTEIIDASDQ